MANTIVSTAETLSINFSPGQDKRFPNTSSESIFSFGDFRIERAPSTELLDAPKGISSLSNFSTLESLSATTFEPDKIIQLETTKLNPKLDDPQSYAYFGSFFTKVGSAINNIITTFPYAILAYNFGTANTILNYLTDSYAGTSTFSLPMSALTNQGNVVIASGTTQNTGTISLFDNFDQFCIQLSGDTAHTETHRIIKYSYTTGTTGLLNFTIEGSLLTGTTTASTAPVYIRPSPQRFGQYKRTISNIEKQLLFDGTFMISDPKNDGTFIKKQFKWPKTIDGFNPDTYGDSFSDYAKKILDMAKKVDEAKTDWMIRTMIPENLLELDTDTQIYRKLLAVYSEEFDKIKQYIDGLAFAHTITYDTQENVPDKFISRLAKLLGFRLNDSFTDADIFEYLASEDDDGKSLSDYNLDLWRRILTNIDWLYKKKGTRDAIMFIFKLIGAPDCLVNFNEFVYKVNKTVVNFDTRVVDEFSNENPKVTDEGYPNYANSDFVFQEGGAERGNGQSYIDQWRPEFDPIKTIDNIKVTTGSTEFFGTQNIINSKEVTMNIDPASAIECDVKDWLKLGYGTWLWGSTATTFSPHSALPISGITVPFEWLIDNVSGVTPTSITGMTIAQWLDFIYASNVNPTNRKTYGKDRKEGVYHDLKRIYITYMFWTNNQPSNRLTFQKLEKFLDLIERNFFDYVPQLIPATTIYEAATVYRNTVFKRQKFVYPEGINRGSEFQKELPPAPEDLIRPILLTPRINEFEQPVIEAFTISPSINEIPEGEIDAFAVLPSINEAPEGKIDAFAVTSMVNVGIKPSVQTFATVMKVNEEETIFIPKQKKFSGMPITFPAPVVAVTAKTVDV